MPLNAITMMWHNQGSTLLNNTFTFLSASGKDMRSHYSTYLSFPFSPCFSMFQGHDSYNETGLALHLGLLGFAISLSWGSGPVGKTQNSSSPIISQGNWSLIGNNNRSDWGKGRETQGSIKNDWSMSHPGWNRSWGGHNLPTIPLQLTDGLDFFDSLFLLISLHLITFLSVVCSSNECSLCVHR